MFTNLKSKKADKMLLEKLKSKIEALELRKQNILTGLKVSMTYDKVVSAGKEIESIKLKIWAIEEAMYS
jgi:hypothetical protein